MTEPAETAIEYLHVGPYAYEPYKSGRKFYEVRPDGALGRLPFEIIDKVAFNFSKLGPHPDGKGFPDYEGVPILRFNPKRKRISDLNKNGSVWVVSDRARRLFERVDPAAFEFRPTEAMKAGKPREGDPYWLCAPIRVLDAIDENRSEIWIGRLGDHYTYSSLHLTQMKVDIVGNAHAFSPTCQVSTNVFDDVMVDEISQIGLAGFIYLDFPSVERANRQRAVHSLRPLSPWN